MFHIDFNTSFLEEISRGEAHIYLFKNQVDAEQKIRKKVLSFRVQIDFKRAEDKFEDYGPSSHISDEPD